MKNVCLADSFLCFADQLIDVLSIEMTPRGHSVKSNLSLISSPLPQPLPHPSISLTSALFSINKQSIPHSHPLPTALFLSCFHFWKLTNIWPGPQRPIHPGPILSQMRPIGPRTLGLFPALSFIVTSQMKQRSSWRFCDILTENSCCEEQGIKNLKFNDKSTILKCTFCPNGYGEWGIECIGGVCKSNYWKIINKLWDFWTYHLLVNCRSTTFITWDVHVTILFASFH